MLNHKDRQSIVNENCSFGACEVSRGPGRRETYISPTEAEAIPDHTCRKSGWDYRGCVEAFCVGFYGNGLRHLTALSMHLYRFFERADVPLLAYARHLAEWLGSKSGGRGENRQDTVEAKVGEQGQVDEHLYLKRPRPRQGCR
jgi:hypothetical protein